MNQDEIHVAVEAYVRNQITIAKTQAITIDFTAGRGPNGLSATLDIRPASTIHTGSVKRSLAAVTDYEPDQPDPKPEQETVSADEAEEQDSPETDGEEEAAGEAEDSSEAPAPRTSIFAKKAAS